MRPIDPAFSDAVQRGALAWACGGDPEQLKKYFEQEGLPFEPSLLRHVDGQDCHVYYQPTVRGFRASPEDDPIKEIYASVNGVAFLAQRSQQTGDGLDILKGISSSLSRPVDVTLAMSGGVSEKYYHNALAAHFRATTPHISRETIPDGDYDPWMQDILKPGYAHSTGKTLMTRNAFEGDLTMGSDMRQMLSSLQGGSEQSFVGGRRLAIHYRSAKATQTAATVRDNGKALLGDGTHASGIRVCAEG